MSQGETFFIVGGLFNYKQMMKVIKSASILLFKLLFSNIEQVRVGPAGWSLVTSNPTSHMECFPHVGFIYTYTSYTSQTGSTGGILQRNNLIWFHCNFSRVSVSSGLKGQCWNRVTTALRWRWVVDLWSQRSRGKQIALDEALWASLALKTPAEWWWNCTTLLEAWRGWELALDDLIFFLCVLFYLQKCINLSTFQNPCFLLLPE